MAQNKPFKAAQDAHFKLRDIITRRAKSEAKRRNNGQVVYSSTTLQTEQLAEVHNILDDGLLDYQKLLDERPSLIEKAVLFNSIDLLDRRGFLPPVPWPDEKLPLIESIKKSTALIQARWNLVSASKGEGNGQD